MGSAYSFEGRQFIQAILQAILRCADVEVARANLLGAHESRKAEGLEIEASEIALSDCGADHLG